MNTLEINGIRLAYDRRGQGKPLVLLHGYPLDHHLWDDLVPLLEDQFDIILPDLRGFGRSSTVDSFYAMEDIASDIAGHARPKRGSLQNSDRGGR
jgi:pimeloyl-ACP methyl ester carboxylesterase